MIPYEYGLSGTREAENIGHDPSPVSAKHSVTASFMGEIHFPDGPVKRASGAKCNATSNISNWLIAQL